MLEPIQNKPVSPFAASLQGQQLFGAVHQNNVFRPQFGGEDKLIGKGKGAAPAAAPADAAQADGDTVEIKAGKKTGEARETDAAKDAAETGAADKDGDQQQQPAPKASGSGSDNLKASAGYFLKRIVPLLLSIPLATGPAGWVLFAAGFPVSYLSSKLGKKLMAGVDENNLNGIIASVTKFDRLLANPESAQKGEMLNAGQGVLDDLVNVHLKRFQNTPLVGYGLKKMGLGSEIKLTETKGLGKFLTKFSMARANMYTEVAKADNVGQAFARGAKGGLEYVFYFKVLSKLGTMIERMPLPFAKPIGMAVKNFGLAKLGWDLITK